MDPAVGRAVLGDDSAPGIGIVEHRLEPTSLDRQPGPIAKPARRASPVPVTEHQLWLIDTERWHRVAIEQQRRSEPRVKRRKFRCDRR